MKGTIFIKQIAIVGSDDTVYEIRSRTNHGRCGPQATLYATKMAVNNTVQRVTGDLVAQGCNEVQVLWNTGEVK